MDHREAACLVLGRNGPDGRPGVLGRAGDTTTDPARALALA